MTELLPVEHLRFHHLIIGCWLTFVGESQGEPGFAGEHAHFFLKINNGPSISLSVCFLIDKLKIETSKMTGYFLAGPVSITKVTLKVPDVAYGSRPFIFHFARIVWNSKKT